MPNYSLSEIADALGGRAEGDVDLRVTAASEPKLATEQVLALAMSPKYAQELAKGAAVSAIVWEGADWQALGLRGAIFPDCPRLVMAGLTALFDPGPDIAPGIHPTACIDPSSKIADDCAIGPFTIVGPDVVIGAGCRIAGHVCIARGTRIGENCLILSGVRIETDVSIGNRVILHPNAVIGADGFSFVTDAPSSVERTRAVLTDTNASEPQNWVRVHSLGTVRLEDDVEIGSNSNVDRGTVRETVVGRGTKIDNQVQIGHNAIIGEDCMICSQVGVAGSATIGNRVVLAGRVAVNDNIFVGDDVVAGGASKLFTNVPAGRVVLGDPAIKITAQVESYKAFRRLPRLFRDVAALKKAAAQIEDKD